LFTRQFRSVSNGSVGCHDLGQAGDWHQCIWFVEDRVVPGLNGYIYAEGNVEALTQHMRFFISNKDEIQNYGREARKTACDYPVDLAIRKFESLTGTTTTFSRAKAQRFKGMLLCYCIQTNSD
jgi:hypothetical protein